jgi:hypothetical protein
LLGGDINFVQTERAISRRTTISVEGLMVIFTKKRHGFHRLMGNSRGDSSFAKPGFFTKHDMGI